VIISRSVLGAAVVFLRDKDNPDSLGYGAGFGTWNCIPHGRYSSRHRGTSPIDFGMKTLILSLLHGWMQLRALDAQNVSRIREAHSMKRYEQILEKI